MVFGDTFRCHFRRSHGIPWQVGSSLAWSPCGRRVAVGCEKKSGRFNGWDGAYDVFLILFCDVLSTLDLYFIHDLYLCYPILMVIYLLKMYGDLVGTTVLSHFFIRFSYSRAHHFSKPVA